MDKELKEFIKAFRGTALSEKLIRRFYEVRKKIINKK
jgi:hypothetical protein